MKKEDLKQTEKKKRIKEDISVSRKSILGWFLTFFMISGLMFSLGILVGRGTAPISFNINELEKDIKALKKTFSIDNNDSAANRLSDNPELEFYDALKEGKEDSRIIVKKITQSQVPIPKEEYVQKTVNSTSRDTEIKINITPPDSSEAPAEKIRPNPESAEDKNGRYTIQVAAFRKIEDADKLVRELSLKGYESYRSIGKTQENGIWFRVRIGHFAKREDAKKTLDQLSKNHIKGIVLNK